MLRPTVGCPPLASVMPTHDSPWVDHRPAGFSGIWLEDILRAELGFGGAIFSDDLPWRGASSTAKPVSYTQAALAALQAGCDMVLLCNQSLPTSEGAGSAIDTLIDGLAEAQQGHWQPREASEQRRLACCLRTRHWTGTASWCTALHAGAGLAALSAVSSKPTTPRCWSVGLAWRP